MEIKVIALDIYGTVLASDDADNILPPRKGLEKLFNLCHKKNIRIVSASDSSMVSYDINQLIENRNWDDLSWLKQGIQKHYHLIQNPKEFDEIITEEKINPENLLVIGDNLEKDIGGALKARANYIHVKEYTSNQNYKLDFSKFIN